MEVLIKLLHGVTDKPVAVGFGVSGPEQACLGRFWWSYPFMKIPVCNHASNMLTWWFAAMLMCMLVTAEMLGTFKVTLNLLCEQGGGG